MITPLTLSCVRCLAKFPCGGQQPGPTWTGFYLLSLVHCVVDVSIKIMHCRHQPRIGHLPRIDGKDGTLASRGTRRSRNGGTFTAGNGLVYFDFLVISSSLLALRVPCSKRCWASSHGLCGRHLWGIITHFFDCVGERNDGKMKTSTRHTMQDGVGVWTRGTKMRLYATGCEEPLMSLLNE